MFVPAVLALRRRHPGGLAAGRIARRARGQRRARRADHRLPVRARPGDAGGAGRGLRPRRRGSGYSSRATRLWSHPGRSTWWCWTRQGRSLPAGCPLAGVLTCRRSQPRGLLTVRGRGRAGVRARGGRRDQRGRAKPKPGRCRKPSDFRALPGLGARGTVDGREVVVGRERLFAEHGMTVPGQPGRAVPGLGAGRLHRGAGRLGRQRSAAPSRSPTRSSRRRPPPSRGCARSGCTPCC